jgi:acetyltransferase
MLHIPTPDFVGTLRTSTTGRGVPPTVPRSLAGLTAGPPLVVRRGYDVRVRPVSPTDSERIQKFVRGLSLESRRARFFSPIRELTPDQLERMTHIAFPEAVALVAESVDAKPEVLGIAQYASDDEGPEFAVVVADAWQRRGIGRWLVRQVVALAGVAGFPVLRGFVLVGNASMLALARSLGFELSADSDPELVRVVRRLPRARLPA